MCCQPLQKENNCHRDGFQLLTLFFLTQLVKTDLQAEKWCIKQCKIHSWDHLNHGGAMKHLYESGFKRQSVMWGWVYINMGMTKVFWVSSLSGFLEINSSCSSESVLFYRLTHLLHDSEQCLTFGPSCSGKQLFQLTHIQRIQER